MQSRRKRPGCHAVRERLLVALELFGALEDLLFQRGVQFDERLLGELAFCDLALRRLRKMDIVDGNRRFGRKPRKAPFRALRKDAGLAVATRQGFAGSGTILNCANLNRL